MNIQELKNVMSQSEQTAKEYVIRGKLKDIYRTEDGLNIFTIFDASSELKASVFTPGTQAYPEFQQHMFVELVITKKIYNGVLQGNLLRASVLDSSDALELERIMEEELNKQYVPKDTTLLIPTDHFKLLQSSLLQVATQIRKAVINQRPILITHHADCDGFSAGFLLERAITALIEKYHRPRYMNNHISRVPSRTPYYDIMDATKDIGQFLTARLRNDLQAPLIIIADNGSTEQDLLSIQKAKLFGADFVVVDHHHPGKLDEHGKSLICSEVLAHVNSYLVGITTSISASLLSYQLAYYINRHNRPSSFIATLGAISDKCDGPEIPIMIAETGYDKAYLAKIGMMVDYEIYLTKMNTQTTVLHSLLSDDVVQRDALISLYEPEIKKMEEEIQGVVSHYVKREQHGLYAVLYVDGELVTQRGDYYSIGKLAGITHATLGSSESPTITCVYSDSMLVFRITQDEEKSFDVFKVLDHLQKTFPFARVTGGGHPVAGSIKFLPIAKDDILKELFSLCKQLD